MKKASNSVGEKDNPNSELGKEEVFGKGSREKKRIGEEAVQRRRNAITLDV